MSCVTQTITLTSDRHYGRRLPSQPVGRVLTALPSLVRASISMAFRGRSGVRGPRPGWLTAASDIRLTDLQGDDDGVLVFDAPTLGEAAAELYRQGELWPTRPDPGATGFDLLGDVLRDVAAGNEDSDRFDKMLLKSLIGFKNVLNGAFRELRLGAVGRDSAPPALINAGLIQTARGFQATTPLPRRVRVVGVLDMVRVSTQNFAMRLDDGDIIRGVLLSGTVVETAPLLDKRVVVLGSAIYRASGRLLRIDADEITAAEGESSFFSRVPPAITRRRGSPELVRDQAHKKGVAAILGQWPGDETDDEIEQALRDMSE